LRVLSIYEDIKGRALEHWSIREFDVLVESLKYESLEHLDFLEYLECFED